MDSKSFHAHVTDVDGKATLHYETYASVETMLGRKPFFEQVEKLGSAALGVAQPCSSCEAEALLALLLRHLVANATCNHDHSLGLSELSGWAGDTLSRVLG